MLSEDPVEEDMSISVLVEVWQQQRYSPISGWLAVNGPLHGHLMPNMIASPFTDITGRIAVTSTDGISPSSRPKILLVDGWRWVSEWMVDLDAGGVDGHDDDGWVYGRSLDQLIESCINRSNASLSPFSIFRRRRWIRTRQCVSESGKVQYISSVKWLSSMSSNMARIRMEVDQDVDEVILYEEQRYMCHMDTLHDIDMDMEETLDILDGLEEKLLALSSLLSARGKIEEEYAMKLKKFSEDWSYPKSSSSSPDTITMPSDSTFAQDPADSHSTGRRSLDSDRLNFLQDSNNDSKAYLQGGLFHSMSSVQGAVAQRVWDFAAVLTNSLPAG
jgi:Integral peroxisomal membrane peroxin